MIHRFRLLEWIQKYRDSCKYNLSNSGLSFPNLEEFGINTNFNDFLDVKDNAEKLFKKTVADLYNVKEENVLVTVGGSEGIFIASYFLKEKFRDLFVPVPEYEPIFLVPQMLGMNVHLDYLENFKSGVVSSSLPNNPTGSDSILDYMDNIEFYYFDETFRDFSFDNKPKSIFQEYKNGVVSNTMTKFYGLSDLRVGWIISEKENIDEMRKIRNLLTINASSYSLWLAWQVLNNREKFVERAKRILTQNKKIFNEYMEDIDGIDYTIENVPFVFVKVENKNTLDLAKIAAENYSILIAPGEFFGSRNSLRVCITSEGKTFEKSMKKLREFFENELK